MATSMPEIKEPLLSSQWVHQLSLASDATNRGGGKEMHCECTYDNTISSHAVGTAEMAAVSKLLQALHTY